MILNDVSLRDWASNGGITPYDPERINPASIDLCWSGRLRYAGKSAGWSDEILVKEFIFRPGELYLLDTIEYIAMPHDCAGMLALKSSIGRLGLEHLHAGYFDPAFHGTATLEVHNLAPWPVLFKAGDPIVQLVLYRMENPPEKSYLVTGRYNGQIGPTTQRSKTRD